MIKLNEFVNLTTARQRVISFLCLLSLLFVSLSGFSAPVPKNSYIYDETGTTSTEFATFLNDVNEQLKSSGAQIGVAILQNLNGNDLEETALNTLRTWGIGDRKKNNGVLILLSMDEHLLRIETGYGAEGFLTDGASGRLIREVIAPEFKAGDYNAGLAKGVYAIAQRAAKEYNLELNLDKASRQYFDDYSQIMTGRMRNYKVYFLSMLLFLFLFIILMNKRGMRRGARGTAYNNLLDLMILSQFFGGGRGGRGGFGGGGFSGGSSFGGFGGGSGGGGGASGSW